MIPIRKYVIAKVYDAKTQSSIITINKGIDTANLSFKVVSVSESCEEDVKTTIGKFISLTPHVDLKLVHPEDSGEDRYCLIHETGITGILEEEDYKRIYGMNMPEE